MKPKLPTLAVALLWAVHFSGCSDDANNNVVDGGVADGAASSGGSTGNGPLNADACQILLKADADAALMRNFQAGEAGDGDVKGTATTASVSNCVYFEADNLTPGAITVGLLARLAPNDQAGPTPEATKQQLARDFGPLTDVGGLGDSAFWYEVGSTANRTKVQLSVFKGKRLWLIFSVTGALPVNEAAASTITMARSAMARI